MKENEYITIPQLAKILGLSRIAVYKKVKKGEIEAIRIGRNFAIPFNEVEKIKDKLYNVCYYSETEKLEASKGACLIRDDFACRLCKKYDRLHIHHIDGNRKNNRLNNLVALCSHCHNYIHKTNLDKAIDKVFREYGEVIKKLGRG